MLLPPPPPQIDKKLCHSVSHDTLPGVVGILGSTGNFTAFINAGQIDEIPAYREKVARVLQREDVPVDTT